MVLVNDLNMNKVKTTMGADAYSAPHIKVYEIRPESLICTSYNSEAFSDEETGSGNFEIDY